MSMMRLQFAGKIHKVEHKMAGTKALCEVSLFKKHKAKTGPADDSYTWIRVNIWEPADWQKPLLIKGAFIAGSGDIQLRSYDAKDGTKKTSLDVRCSSFDIEVADASQQTAPVTEYVDPRNAGARAPETNNKTPPHSDDLSCPF